MTKRAFLIFLLSKAALLSAVQTATAQQAADQERTHIFFSASSVDCWPFTEDIKELISYESKDST